MNIELISLLPMPTCDAMSVDDSPETEFEHQRRIAVDLPQEDTIVVARSARNDLGTASECVLPPPATARCSERCCFVTIARSLIVV